ncbi:AAA family ATPase [Dysgonomonas termitidis]|uniref:AAA family ATPase n=1 Tax=Dysgonomonas termitidis TaxID=1516126 RepID=A0ABV9KRU9_9BACT
MKYKIISVESRKGGVGKTTAALNLSALLVERGYKTLLLDVDITGTSIEGSYNSAFWKGKINSIKQNKKDINLLKIFHDVFLKGEGLPEFSFENGSNNEIGVFNTENNNNFIISPNKINIFNSEIYNDDSSLICDPIKSAFQIPQISK